MYEIDKQAFGAFVASLRKEQGYTQKELSAKLYISDKAISKWETGVSIPDVSLLIPLSEALDVSVTELLQCRRLPQNTAMDTSQVEDLVKTAIQYDPEHPVRRIRRRNVLLYAGCFLLAAVETVLLMVAQVPLSEYLMGALVAGILVGFYSLIAAPVQLPSYYDSNRITSYSDGPVRMNLGSIPISNRNWPHLLKVLQRWSLLIMTLYPLLALIAYSLSPQLWLTWEKLFFGAALLGGMLFPLLRTAAKYQ